MRRRKLALPLMAATLALTWLPLVALAEAIDPPPPVEAAAAPDAAVVPADAPPAAPAPLSAEMQEIHAAWDAHVLAVGELEARLAGAVTDAASLALQRQIEDLRGAVEVEILGIQARHARAAGRLEVAAELDAAIAALTAPRPRAVPIERSPADAGGR